jgi:hypothetical protein
MRQQRIACLVILALCGLASAQVDQTAKKLRDAKISDLTFMSGHWRGELEGEVTDEHWAEPLGDSLMGVFRSARSGKVTFYELMAIEQEEKGPVFRLKHFNRGLIAWEEKAEVWNYPLVELRDDYAAFERPDKGTKLIYHRTGKDTMEATLERVKDGKKTTEVFRFWRVNE